MDAAFLSFAGVEYSYPSSIDPVLRNVSFDLRKGWTGIVGENGAGKTTLLLLAAGLLRPSAGAVKRPGAILYCPQRTDHIPEGWEDFFGSADNEIGALRGRLGIGYDWPYRWDSLSHGERKRLQLAIALSAKPALLAVDEPTNHLDMEARALIGDALAAYEGIGLLVSHDRALLDGLCRSCLFLEAGGATLRPGGVSQGLAEGERERLEQGRARGQLLQERKRLASEADQRRRLAEGARSRVSKKNLDPKDSDARGKINRAIITGKDAVGGRLYRRMENRVGRLDRELDAAKAPANRKIGLSLEGAASKADRLFCLEPGSVALGQEGRALSHPELSMAGLDRVALTGPNGSGKSTLMRRVVAAVPPAIPTLYLPQELTEAESRAALAEVFVEDEKSRGEILSRFSRLGPTGHPAVRAAQPRRAAEAAHRPCGVPRPGLHRHGRAHQPPGPQVRAAPGGAAQGMPLRPAADKPRPGVPFGTHRRRVGNTRWGCDG